MTEPAGREKKTKVCKNSQPLPSRVSFIWKVETLVSIFTKRKKACFCINMPKTSNLLKVFILMIQFVIMPKINFIFITLLGSIRCVGTS